MFRQLITGQGLAPEGEQVFTSKNSLKTFTVPNNVSQISVVLVGGGAGASGNDYGTISSGGGGSLVYATIPVTPGETLGVYVGGGGEGGNSGGRGDNGVDSYVSRSGTQILMAPGGQAVGDTTKGSHVITSTAIVSDFNAGGPPVSGSGAGGSGAGGYSGAGGTGSASGDGSAGSGGAGGGGGEALNASGSYLGGYGGGVGLYGEGASGAGGTYPGGNGGDGSGGSYGGGGGAGNTFDEDAGQDRLRGNDGVQGAIRIIWPGRTRRFPSTNTA